MLLNIFNFFYNYLSQNPCPVNIGNESIDASMNWSIQPRRWERRAWQSMRRTGRCRRRRRRRRCGRWTRCPQGGGTTTHPARRRRLPCRRSAATTSCGSTGCPRTRSCVCGCGSGSFLADDDDVGGGCCSGCGRGGESTLPRRDDDGGSVGRPATATNGCPQGRPAIPARSSGLAAGAGPCRPPGWRSCRLHGRCSSWRALDPLLPNISPMKQIYNDLLHA